MRYKRTCNHCAWAWVVSERADERCPRCQSPSYRSRPAPFFRAEPLVRSARPNRPLRAAGWYADPADRYAARWWDGDGWTERVWSDGREAIDTNPMGLSDLWEHPEHGPRTGHPGHPTIAAR